MDFRNKNILLGITSSIAAYKAYELIRLYIKNGFNVKTVVTENSLNFISPLVLEALSKNPCYINQFGPKDKVKHIELTKWADIFVIAPITANTISKLSNGIADNLLTSIACAYIGTKKPMMIAPAMNDNMWNNPIIQKNIEELKNQNIKIIEPQIGFLACNSEGKGRLADIETIYHNTLRGLFQKKENNDKKVIVTYGGTKEKIDSVRYITNSSSGKMGSEIALCAYHSGFNVIAISTFDSKMPFKTIVAQSADEMFSELKKQDFNYLIMAAAVSDFRAKEIHNLKISKEEAGDDFALNLTKNPDIVATIAKNKKEHQKIIGFCLTDKDLLNCAKAKLINKNLDYIIANDVKIALNTNKNQVTIIEKSGKITDIELDTKENIARKILEVVCD